MIFSFPSEINPCFKVPYNYTVSRTFVKGKTVFVGCFGSAADSLTAAPQVVLQINPVFKLRAGLYAHSATCQEANNPVSPMISPRLQPALRSGFFSH
jgi:hypothetical protein